MDPVSDIFRTLKVTALVQSRLDASAPWSVRLLAEEAQNDGSIAQRPGVAYFGMVAEGQCWLLVDGEPEPILVVKGDCFLLAPRISFTLADQLRTPPVSFCQLRDKEVNNVIQYGGGGATTSVVSCILQFNQGSIRPIAALLPNLILIRAEQSAAAGLQATLQIFAAEMTLLAPGAEVAADRLAEVMFVQVLRLQMASEAGQRKRGWLRAIFDPQIGSSLKAFHANVAATWTVESLADAAGMSRSAFASRFKELLGETPFDYVTEWRMQKSLELLVKGDRKISDVAQHVGYETDAAFNKAFKRTIGATPGRYREQQLHGAMRPRVPVRATTQGEIVLASLPTSA